MSQTNYWPSVELQPKNLLALQHDAVAPRCSCGFYRTRSIPGSLGNKSTEQQEDRQEICFIGKNDTTCFFTPEEENDSFHFFTFLF